MRLFSGIIFSVFVKTNVMNKNEDDNRRLQKQEDRDLPGYPHYPPDEDIMNPQSGFKKIQINRHSFIFSFTFSKKALSQAVEG